MVDPSIPGPPTGDIRAGKTVMTAEEAARFLRVDVEDVRQAISEGTLAVIRNGSQVLIDRQALLRKLDPLYEAPPAKSLRGRVDTSARVCEAITGAGYVNEAWREAAKRLLGDLVAVADRHGITLRDFDRVTDLPQACLDALAPAYRPRPKPQLRAVSRRLPAQH
jgi:excisionase family DNA binding protein